MEKKLNQEKKEKIALFVGTEEERSEDTLLKSS
jgi:hypothetical protein